jgi:hypothetical protein
MERDGEMWGWTVTQKAMGMQLRKQHGRTAPVLGQGLLAIFATSDWRIRYLLSLPRNFSVLQYCVSGRRDRGLRADGPPQDVRSGVCRLVCGLFLTDPPSRGSRQQGGHCDIKGMHTRTYSPCKIIGVFEGKTSPGLFIVFRKTVTVR